MAPWEPVLADNDQGESSASEAPSVAPSAVALNVASMPSSSADAVQRGLDADMEETRKRLLDQQQNARIYFGTWFSLQVALISINTVVAVRATRDVMRGSYALAATLSSASFLHLITEHWPALGSYRRFSRLPEGTAAERVAKITYAENVLAAQANHDRMATAADRHIGVGVIAAACGLGIGLGYSNLKEGLSRGFGILLVGELQLLTRPNVFAALARSKSTALSSLTLAPWGDRRSSGMSVSAQF